MPTYESLAAENAKLKAILENKGFKITYSAKTGSIVRISAPRKPSVKYIAITWAKKKGYTSSMSMVKKMTKGKPITERKFKNAVERANMIRDAQEFLSGNNYKVSDKFFNRVPTYVLKNTDFYENVNAILNSTADSEAEELTNDTINYAMKTSIYRIRRLNKISRDPSKLKNIAKKSLNTNLQKAAMEKLTKGNKTPDPSSAIAIANEALGITFQGAATKKLKKSIKKFKK